MILTMFCTSAFAATKRDAASRTFSGFPFSGNTPYRSRPTTVRPAIANAAAESPSVRISVHSCAFFEPAKFASSNLSTRTV